jgi:hypothetical protein
MARIDTPQLDKLYITFFHQLIFETLRLTQFIDRTPKFKTHNEARLVFSDRHVWIATFDGALELTISCRPSDWQLSSLALFPRALVPAVEHLYILEKKSGDLQDDIENIQWMELLHPFTAVKSLYISRKFVLRIGSALQELVGEGVMEVLPVLQTLHLEEPLLPGSVQGTVGRFVAARQLANHPIAVSRWELKSALRHQHTSRQSCPLPGS